MRRKFNYGVLTILIAVACGMVFFKQLSNQNLFNLYGNIPERTINGEYYRLITCGFLHASFGHIAANMIMLFSIGPIIESEGKIKYIITYIFSMLAGSGLSLIYNIQQGRMAILSVGASGAIFGLIGAAFAYSKINKGVGRYNRLGEWVIEVVILNVIAAFTMPNIDFMAHVGGFIGGFLITLLLNLGGRK